MQRPPNRTNALALTALIMAAGTSAHAQFQFLTDQPLNATDTPRRNARTDEGVRAPTSPSRGFIEPEPEKKGFFGRLFSRDEPPVRAQIPPPASASYFSPDTTYVRGGVRYSNPPNKAPVPAPQYAPQAPVNSTWPPATPRFTGTGENVTEVVPPNAQSQPFETRVVSESPRYLPGAEPTVSYRVPAPAPQTIAKSSPSNAGADVFSGQRARRADAGASATPSLPVASPYTPQGLTDPVWPPAQADARVIGAQWQTSGSSTTVIPPSGQARSIPTHVVNEGVRYASPSVPAGYPVPPPQASADSLDRPGFFSRLFGASATPAAATSSSVSDGTRYAPGAKVVAAPFQEDVPQRPPAASVIRSLAPSPTAPAAGSRQDPFSGQRPTRRGGDFAPEVPLNAPTPGAPSSFVAPRSSLDVAPGFAPASVPANLSSAEARAFQPGVKPEDTRYLMYLYAKTGRADLAEPLAQEILTRDPANKEALLAMSSLFVDKKDAPRAVAYATQLYQAYPDSNEALYYYGAAQQLAGNYSEAANVLRYLRLEKFAGKPFPYQLDLAGASEKSGNWRGQMTAYQELLDQNQVDDPTRTSVRRVLEPMQREHSDQVTAQGTAYLLKSGALWQERATGRTEVTDRHQIYVDAGREDVLVRKTALLNRRWADDTEGWLGWQANWSHRWITDLWAGGYQGGPLGGARVTHRLASNGAVWMEGFANERARDGLLLNSLDGRQHRVSLAGNYLFAERFQAYGTFTGREVLVDGQELANGFQGSWGMDFLARRESPDFKFGYHGTYSATSRKTGNTALVAPAVAPGTTLVQQGQVLDTLLLHWLHREGVHADLRDRLWGPFFYHLQGTAEYAFEREAMEYGGRVGLTYRPRKSLEFGTQVAYTTGAATTDGSNDAWEVGVSMKWWF